MKQSLRTLRQWFEATAAAMDFDPVEDLHKRVAVLEAEIAQMKSVRADTGTHDRKTT